MFEVIYRLIKTAYIRTKFFLRGLDVNEIIPAPAEHNTHKRYIHHYAQSNNIAGLQEEILAGANVDMPNRQGNTPLHLACARGNIEAVRLLIAEGANLNIGNNGGFRPLTMCLAYSGQEDEKKACMEALIAAGAEVDYVDAHGDTPYDLCAAPQLFSREPPRQAQMMEEILSALIEERPDFPADPVGIIVGYIYNRKENANEFIKAYLDRTNEQQRRDTTSLNSAQ